MTEFYIFFKDPVSFAMVTGRFMKENHGITFYEVLAWRC